MERKIQFKSIFCGGGVLPVLVKYQQKKADMDGVEMRSISRRL